MRFFQITSIVAIALATMVASAPVPLTDSPNEHQVSLHDVQDDQPQPHPHPHHQQHHRQRKHKNHRHHQHHHHHQQQQSEAVADPSAVPVPPVTETAQTTIVKRGGKPAGKGKGRNICAAQRNSVWHELAESLKYMPASETKGIRLAAGIGEMVEWGQGKYKGCK